MSYETISKDYIKHRDIIETEFYGYVLQYYRKYKVMNIYAPKGIDMKVFMAIKERFKNVDKDLMINVNW